MRTTLDHAIDSNECVDMFGEKAWLGANVTVLQGVPISDGAIVGAGAFVQETYRPTRAAPAFQQCSSA